MNKASIADFIDKIGDGIHGTPCYSENGSYYFVNGNNLKDGHIVVDSSTLKIEQNEYEKIKRPLNENTILISINGTIGNLAFYNGEKIALGKSACYMNVKSTENKHYIRYVLSTQEFKKYALQVAHGSTIKNLAPRQIAEYTFLAPDSASRANIAYVLKILDDKIENNNKIYSELESMAKTLYDYWFVQFDFPDENGKPYKSSGGKMIWDEELGQKIPDGWKSVPLSSVFEFEKGRIPNHIETAPTTECDTPYLTIDVVNAGAPSFCSSKNMILANGEVLMVMDGAASSDVYAGYNGAIGSTFAKCTIKNKSMSNQLLYVILRRYNNVFAKVNTGSTVPHANKDYILNFRIPLPNCAKLKDLSEKFVSILSLVYAAREENRELTSFRDFLLPMLMNGQVKIKDSESGAERNAET